MKRGGEGPASIGDGQRGTRFQQMYDLARAHAAAGIGFWNVGPQMKDTFDVNQRSPLTAEAVRRNAPR